jgi:D-alanyl-D-alanine carboxypeptidase
VNDVVASGVPGVIVRVQDGQRPARLSVAGVSDLATGEALRPAAQFRIGSITEDLRRHRRPAAGGRGTPRLDEPVAGPLPGLLTNGQNITVRQLLNHTSGLPDYTADPELFAGILENRQWQPRELVALAEKQPQTFDPGSAWTYSSTNYIVAGLLVEAVTGRPLARELDRRIFAPLRLRHTSLPATARVSGYHAHGYITTELVPTADGQPLDVTGFNPSHAWAAGAIVSNAADLSTFFRALLSGRLLPPALLQEMKQTVAEDPTDPQKTFSYGLGLRRVADTCGANWGHTGTIFGYQSMAFWNEHTNRSVVVASTMFFAPAAPKLPSPRRQISPCAPTPTRRETPRLGDGEWWRGDASIAVAAASLPVTRLALA